MREKRILYYAPTDVTLGLRWDRKSGIMTIGGPERFETEIRWIVQNCFSMPISKPKYPSTGRIKFCTVGRFGRATWDGALLRLSSSGWDVRSVTNLERMFR